MAKFRFRLREIAEECRQKKKQRKECQQKIEGQDGGAVKTIVIVEFLPETRTHFLLC